MEMRTCTKCGQAKPSGAFYKNKRVKSGLMARCKECQNARQAEYLRNNPEARDRAAAKKRERYLDPEERARQIAYFNEWAKKNPDRMKINRRNHHLRKTYGITLAEYDQMLAIQEGSCAICRSTEPGNGHVTFHVDHCHGSGRVRALLCNNCNTGIGHFREDPDLMTRAIEYLRTHQGEVS